MDAEFENHLKVAEEFSTSVLGPYEARPPREDINMLIGELIRLGLPLAAKLAAIPKDELFPWAEGAVSDWRYFVAKGALGESDHSRWNYARGLSRVLRSLTAGIREHQHQPTGTL
ncbi:hypothetical protein [Streptomyces sp. NPDC051183]|uniref:hypothetical protein n=1 Tax=unclassified Streptomyces TaxID=2593676 RepID=UPI003425441A